MKADLHRTGRSVLGGLALCVLFATFMTAAAPAAPNNELNKTRLDSTVRFLQNAQSAEGGFSADGNPSEASDAEFTAWVALALAAAGINPQDQAAPGGTSDYTYLVEHADELRSTTDLERALLVVDASGTSPEDFGDVHLVRQILARQLTATSEAGAFTNEAGEPDVNGTIFAILALSPVQEPAAQSAVKLAVSWLLDEQDPGDDGWPAVCPRTVTGCSERDEVDMTAAAIQALNAAGQHGTPAQSKALGFLRSAQNPDGGFAESPGEHESNTASTSWAVQAIWSAGENPEEWRTAGTGKEPLGFLESMQREDGSVRWKASSNENPMLMTAYAAPAYSGDPWPIPAPPYVPLPSAVPGGTVSAPAPSAGSEPGGGGASPGSGGGVIAGGGGNGAPLFSRPQPGSRGVIPGGARQPESGAAKSSGKALAKRRDPGSPREAPPATIAAGTPESAHHGSGSGVSGPRVSNSGASGPRVSGSGGSGSSSAEAAGSRARLAFGGGPVGRGGPVIKGVLIGAPSASHEQTGVESGAPGLRSAASGGEQTPWLALAIGGLFGLLMLAGSQIERRRTQVIL